MLSILEDEPLNDGLANLANMRPPGGRPVPRCADAYAIRGRAFYNLERHEAAAEDFETAIDLRPNHWDAQYEVGHVYRQLRRCDEAIAAFEVAARLRPEDDFIPLHGMALTYDDCGDYAKAIALYVRELDEHPTMPESWKDDIRDRIARCRSRLRSKR